MGLKKQDMFSAFDPEPEENIAMFLTNVSFHQKYNKQTNVKTENQEKLQIR